MSTYNVASLSAAKINVTELNTVANISAAKIGVTGSITCTALTVGGNLNLINGNLGVSGYVDARLDYVPTDTNDNVIKQNMEVIIPAAYNIPRLGDTGPSKLIYNWQNVTGNAFTDEQNILLYGDRNYTGSDLNEDCYYKLLSASKLIGALCAAKAMEERLIDIDDPVYKYLGDTGNFPGGGLTGWFSKEKSKVLVWTPKGETKPGGGVSAGEDKLYDTYDGFYQIVNYVLSLTSKPPAYPLAGSTGTWGLTGCNTDITIRHLLSMTSGLPSDNFATGASRAAFYNYNPDLAHLQFNRGLYETGVTGVFQPLALPYITAGTTGTIPTLLSDTLFENIRNGLYEYTAGASGAASNAAGVTGTLLMSQPGEVAYYGSDYDLFGPVVDQAIKQANTNGATNINTAVYLNGYAQPSKAVDPDVYGYWVNSVCSIPWKSSVLAAGSTALFSAVYDAAAGGQTALSDYISANSIQGVYEYVRDRILVPVGAENIFAGARHETQPADYTAANKIQLAGSGTASYSLTTGLPDAPVVLPWLVSEGATGALYYDNGYLYAATMAEGVTAFAYAGLGYTASADPASPYYKVVSVQANTISKLLRLDTYIGATGAAVAPDYPGQFGYIYVAKLKDFAKLVKLYTNKGVFNGKTIIGKQAMGFIQMASCPTDIDLRITDPGFVYPLWNPFSPGNGGVNPYLPPAQSAVTWSFGCIKSDAENVSKNTLGLSWGNTDKTYGWAGAFDVYWSTDLNTGVYTIQGTQQFQGNDFNVIAGFRQLTNPSAYPPPNPNANPAISIFQGVPSQYFPLA